MSRVRDEVIIHTSNPNSADNWVRQMFTGPTRKEPDAMSPYEIFILYAVHAATLSALPNCTSEITHRAVNSLLQAEMIKREDQRVSGYALTERGRVYIAAISMVPLPIRSQAPWVMPG